jgi:hypothetical protein
LFVAELALQSARYEKSLLFVAVRVEWWKGF